MKWEYKVIENELSVKELNELGEQGWELVAHERYVQRRIYHRYYFKRPKQKEAAGQ
jgi:hypothetical protein